MPVAVSIVFQPWKQQVQEQPFRQQWIPHDMNDHTFPLVEVEGGAYEMGCQHGGQAAQKPLGAWTTLRSLTLLKPIRLADQHGYAVAHT